MIAPPVSADTPLAEAIDAWLAWLTVLKRSPMTIRNYKNVGTKLVEMLSAEGITTVGALTAGNLRNFIRRQAEAEYANATLVQQSSVLKGLSKFLVEEGAIPGDIAGVLRIRKKPRPIPRYLDRDEMDTLVRSIAGRGEENARDRLMAELALASGLRVGELAALNDDLVNLDKLEVVVRNGKGGKDRISFINRRAAAFYRRYVAIRDRIHGIGAPDRGLFLSIAHSWRNKSGALVTVPGGRRLDQRDIRRTIERRARIPKPHEIANSLLAVLRHEAGATKAQTKGTWQIPAGRQEEEIIARREAGRVYVRDRGLFPKLLGLVGYSVLRLQQLYGRGEPTRSHVGADCGRAVVGEGGGDHG